MESVSSVLSRAAGDLQAELATHVFGDLEGVGAVGVEHDLHQAFAVTQVDEDHAAVVAGRIHPTDEGDSFADVLRADFVTVVRSH